MNCLSFCTLAEHSVLSILVPLKLKTWGCSHIGTQQRSAWYQRSILQLYSLVTPNWMWYFMLFHGISKTYLFPLSPVIRNSMCSLRHCAAATTPYCSPVPRADLRRGPEVLTLRLFAFAENSELGTPWALHTKHPGAGKGGFGVDCSFLAPARCSERGLPSFTP